MLKIKDLNYKYNKQIDIPAISNINMEVVKGECVLLCGRSGSGKTTITKVINSLIPNFYETGELSGDIKIADMNTVKSKIYEVSRVVASVFQNPKTQFFNINTTREILFYLENRGFEWQFMHNKLLETAELFGIDYLLDRDIFKLSGGEKQIIAIAAAYASGTEIILLDEPSSNLDIANTKLIGEILSKLKLIGKTIIISEHRFYYIKDIIDRVYYIDGGQIKQEFSKQEFFGLDNKTRKELGLRSIEFEALNINKKFETNSSKKLQIEKLYYPFKEQSQALNIQNLSFDFGTIIGIYGYNGIGKSTFIRILMGLERSNTKIRINEKYLSARQRLKKSYLVMQDVNYQLFTDSVDTEVCLGMSAQYTKADVEQVLKKLNILDLKDEHPMSLSGGQKQRVAVASATLSDADIICFDEPTSGMDYDNMIRISDLIRSTINDKKIIFIISHDHEFLNHTANQIFEIEKVNETFK